MYLERIEKIEEELNIIRYQFEFTKQFIESESEKIAAMKLFTDTMLDFMKDTSLKIMDLQKSYVTLSKNRALQFELIESQGRMIKSLSETINILSQKNHI